MEEDWELSRISLKGEINMEIEVLTLQTNKLKEMKDFYIETLGFPLLSESETHFRIGIGSNELEFSTKGVVGEPYYHFAFNIPGNKFKKAKSWVKERVLLNVHDGEDEVFFSHFPAYAFYFDDPAGNIVEFIARPEIYQKEEGPFTIDDVLTISEIGLTVADAISAGEKLIDAGIHERNHLPLSTTSLNFMGDKSKGIFLILNQPGRQWFFSDKVSAIFPLEITISNQINIIVNSEGNVEVIEMVE